MGNTVIRSIHARHLIDCKTRGLLEVDVITEARQEEPVRPQELRWEKGSLLSCVTGQREDFAEPVCIELWIS